MRSNVMRHLIVVLLLAASLLPGISHAAVDDIGALIFRDFLKVSSYPSAPFTGNIINDLVMFFFIPTVFIIIIIYSITGRMFANARIRLLLGIALYLFIVFGGYFTMFMLLAGPYFLFLIIIIGLFLYFASHFGIRPGGGGATLPGAALGTATQSAGGLRELHALEEQLKELDDKIKKKEQTVEDLRRREESAVKGGQGVAGLETAYSTEAKRLHELENARAAKWEEIKAVKRSMGLKY